MYKKKLEPILEDIENKDVEIAGGSVVGIMLATVNSLIKYIANLTIGKKKYEHVQDEVKQVLNKAEDLKIKSLNVIDKDKEVLEEILDGYKIRKENKEKYIEVCKKGVEFCMEVVKLSFDTLKLSDDISKVGNKMLCSDFEICKNYAFASIKSAIVNVNINLDSIEDEKYKNNITKRYNEILEKAGSYMK